MYRVEVETINGYRLINTFNKFPQREMIRGTIKCNDNPPNDWLFSFVRLIYGLKNWPQSLGIKETYITFSYDDYKQNLGKITFKRVE
jgi:hypothetical protein